MLPWEVDEEMLLLLRDSEILPSLELLDHAYERSWIGLRHINATANLQDAPIVNTQKRALLYQIQLRILRGYFRERLSQSGNSSEL